MYERGRATKKRLRTAVKKPCKAVQKGNRTKHFFSSQGTASNPMMYY